MFEKPADTDYPILDLLKRRWSGRAFLDRPIEASALRSIFEAARWAPSSGNGQPWNYIVARREQSEEFERLASTLNPGNAWARNAGALALSIATLERAPGKPNAYAWHDTGLANAQLTLQAFSMGIMVHQMGGYNSALARQLFAIPEQWEPVAMIAIGYPADPSVLPEDLRQKEIAPRARRSVAEFVYRGRFGQRGGLE